MTKTQPIEVLSGLRFLLKWTNLYNKNGLHFYSVKLPDTLVYCLVPIPSFYLSLLFVWPVIEGKFNLKLLSSSLAFAIGNLQLAFAYISLASKTASIASTLDQLQEIVQKRKSFSMEISKVLNCCD